MSAKPRLFYLLMAIDKYQHPVPPLSGCVNDIRKMKAYLEKEYPQHFDLKPMVLENEAATKAAIVRGFREHLGQAGPNDTVLIYYSGHGTQEDADTEIWRFETDKKLECLVTYDGIVQKNGESQFNLLADKELRYLIHEVSRNKPHILTIFDCCHSGGNTRDIKLSGGVPNVQSRRYVSARLSQACPVRSWDSFIFSNTVRVEDLKTKPLPEVLPGGAHVQIAACNSDQSAYEVDGGGVFTRNLLEVLTRSNGEVTYYDLQSRIRYFIKNEFKQTPQIFAEGRETNLAFKGFLGRPVKSGPLFGNIVFNPTEGWVMDLGAMHGISAQAGTVKVEYPDGSGTFNAVIDSVSMGHTRLRIEDETALGKIDTKESYRGYSAGAMTRPISVFFQVEKGDEAGADSLREVLKSNTSEAVIVDQEAAADYTVVIRNGYYSITLPADHKRPIVQLVKGYEKNNAGIVATYLRYISRWEYVRQLYNPDMHLFTEDPVKMAVYWVQADGSLKEMEPKADEIIADYDALPGGNWGGKIKVQLTNTSKYTLHCSLLYLSQTFQVYPRLLGQSVVQVAPGESAWAFEGEEIELDYESYIKDFNWEYSSTLFKVLAGTREFDVSLMEQEGLPAPTMRGEAKGLKLPSANNMSAADWMARLVTLKVRNPAYKAE